MKQKDLLYLVISSFILTILWIGFNIYDRIATSTISEVLKVQIAPISPDFDQATINKIKKREDVTPVYTFTPIKTKNGEENAAPGTINANIRKASPTPIVSPAPSQPTAPLIPTATPPPSPTPTP